MFSARKRLSLTAALLALVSAAFIAASGVGAAKIETPPVSAPIITTAIATGIPSVEPRGVKIMKRQIGFSTFRAGSLLSLIFDPASLASSNQQPSAVFNNLCVPGGLAAADPDFGRPSITSRGTGVSSPCTTQTPADYNYDTYDFNISGCAAFPSTVDISLCGPAGCAPATSSPLSDSTLFLYRTGGSLTAGTGGVGSFSAGAPCGNVVAANDDQSGVSVDPNDFGGQGAGSACDASGGLPASCPSACVAPNDSMSGLRRKLGPGVFTVVVSSFGHAAAGNYNLYVNAAGAGCTVSQGPGCPTITIAPATIPTVTVNTAYPTQTFTASGGQGPYTFTITGTLPTGMTFTPSANQATISGTPTQQGNFPITINVTDANGCGGSKQYSVVVTNGALSCITDLLGAGGPTFLRPNTQSTLPGFTGTTTPGNDVLYRAYEFNVSGCATTGTFNATLCGPAGCPPTAGTGALADGILYMYRSGGSLTTGTGAAGSFVAGNSLNNLVAANDDQGQASSGGLAACPTNSGLPGLTRTVGPGRFQVVVAALSSNQATPNGSGAYTMNAGISGAGCVLTQVGACPTINVSPSTAAQGQINVPYPTQNLSASGGTGPYTFTMTGTLPTGLTFTPGVSSATITGTPTQSGAFLVTVTATDANGCQGSQQYNIIVANPALSCITDGISAASPSFLRPSLQTALPGFQGCPIPGPSATSVKYRKYDFNLAGAACNSGNVTVSLCGPAGCTPITGPGAIPDAALFIYRTNGLNGGAGTLGAFDPANSCNNLVAANDDQGQPSSGGLVACAANSLLPGLTRTLGSGYFSVVVGGFGSADMGAYSMNVTTSTAGCSITQAVPPTLSLAFAPTSVVSGQPTTVTLTLSSTNVADLTNVSFGDTLVNMSAVGGPVGGTCAGTTPNTLVAGQQALNFSGITVPPAGCTITFDLKSFTPGVLTNQTSGATSNDTGPTVGQQSNIASLTVAKAATTSAINSDLPDPSFLNQAVTVTYAVSVTAPGTGGPTGTVTVTDGVNSCNGTVPAGQCTINLATAGNRTLTATYSGDASFLASPASPGVAHTVSLLTAAGVTISGRVKTFEGRGIRAARVTLTDAEGIARTVNVGPYGEFQFEDVAPGRTYVLSVGQRRYRFEPLVLQVEDNLSDIEIIGQPPLQP